MFLPKNKEFMASIMDSSTGYGRPAGGAWLCREYGVNPVQPLVSNFEFDAYQDGLHAWRYLDLTDHAVYPAKVIGDTLRPEMFEEADLLRRHCLARERLSEVLEAGDNTLDRIIHSVSENRRITGKRLADYPQLAEPDMREKVLNGVLSAVDKDGGPE